jgi:hypothetical protein
VISYMGMALCRRSDCGNFADCPRAFTDQVRADAVKWWGSDGAPVSFAHFTECFVDSTSMR